MCTTDRVIICLERLKVRICHKQTFPFFFFSFLFRQEIEILKCVVNDFFVVNNDTLFTLWNSSIDLSMQGMLLVSMTFCFMTKICKNCGGHINEGSQCSGFIVTDSYTWLDNLLTESDSSYNRENEITALS